MQSDAQIKLLFEQLEKQNVQIQTLNQQMEFLTQKIANLETQVIHSVQPLIPNM
jgi:chaperonin cofactor prefoldin